MCLIPTLRRQREVDPGISLASQPSQSNKYEPQWETLPQKIRWRVRRHWCQPLASTRMCTNTLHIDECTTEAHTWMYTYTLHISARSTETHTWMCTYTLHIDACSTENTWIAHTHYTLVHVPQKHTQECAHTLHISAHATETHTYTHLFREAFLMSWDPRVLALDLSMTKWLEQVFNPSGVHVLQLLDGSEPSVFYWDANTCPWSTEVLAEWIVGRWGPRDCKVKGW